MHISIKDNKKVKVAFIITFIILVVAVLFGAFYIIRFTLKSENERTFSTSLSGTKWYATDMVILDNSTHDLTKEPYISDGGILNNVKFSVFSDTVIFEWNDGYKEYYRYSVINSNNAEVNDDYGSWLITYSDVANLLIVSRGQLVYYLYTDYDNRFDFYNTDGYLDTSTLQLVS